MDKSEIIERLKNIAEHAVHTVGEEPFVMSLDDGIAVHEAIELLEKLEPLTDSDLIQKIEEGIKATGTADVYSVGMCNGMKWCISLIDGKEPLYENCPSTLSDVPGIYVGNMISRQDAIDIVVFECGEWQGLAKEITKQIKALPPVQPKRGTWIMDRSGQYYCSECMEPCATYVMMRPRDKFCKMCGADMRTTETDCDYERAVEQLEHDMLYEPTFNPDDGSM